MDDFIFDDEDGENYNELKLLYLTTLIRAIKRYERLAKEHYWYDISPLQSWAEIVYDYKIDENGRGRSFYETYHDHDGRSTLDEMDHDDFEINLQKYVAECEKAFFMNLCNLEFLLKFREEVVEHLISDFDEIAKRVK